MVRRRPARSRGADRRRHHRRDKAFGDDVAAAITADTDDVHLGRLAAYVRDTRIPLEMCPSSNVQTGAAESVALHPISLLKRFRFRVTVNTDNRLMSGTSMSREMGCCVQDAGWTMEDLRWVTINAMKSAFIPFEERLAIIEGVVKPATQPSETDPGVGLPPTMRAEYLQVSE